jgi:hypothetical protein
MSSIGANQTIKWTGTTWSGAADDIQITGLINNSLTLKNFQIAGTNLSLVKSIVVGDNVIADAVITNTLITVPVSLLIGGTYPVYLVLDNDTRMLPQSFPMQYIALTSNVSSISEGGVIVLTLTSTNLPDGTVVPYTVTGTASLSDTNLVTSTGNFVVNNSTAVLTVQVASDTLVEGTENITVTLDNTGVSVTVNILDSLYALTSYGVTSVNEGSSFQIGLIGQNIIDNTLVPYVITGVAAVDINGASLTGNFTVVNNSAVITFSVTADQITEGTETFTLTLVGTTTSIAVTIGDTSLTPTYAFTTSNAFLDYGNSYTVNIATTNIASGTVLPYTISGVSSSDINNASLTGNVTITNNATSLNITTSDLTPVGAAAAKNMTITVGTGALTGVGVLPIMRSIITSTVAAAGTVSLAWNYYTTAVGTPDTFDVYIDGALQGSPATATISGLTVNSGADRTLLIRPKKSGTYTGADMTRTIRYFAYTGGQQNWTVPSNRNFALVDVGGAQGGELGGEGGRTRTFITTTPSETLYVFVGGVGADGGSTGCVADTTRAGGYNGGGTGGGNRAGCGAGVSVQRLGSGGGGASDIRRGGTALANRFIVSGGGGGCGSNSGFVNSGCGGTAATVGQGAGYGASPGNGGVTGQTGCGGAWPISTAGGAASTSAGGGAGTGDVVVGNAGSLGQGAAGGIGTLGGNNPGRASGGGGGFYGGGGGGINSNYGSGGSGGGGSGYLDPALTTLWNNYGVGTAGGITGNGKVLIIV